MAPLAAAPLPSISLISPSGGRISLEPVVLHSLGTVSPSPPQAASCLPLYAVALAASAMPHGLDHHSQPCRVLSPLPPHQSHARVFATRPQVCSPGPTSGLAPSHPALATWCAPPPLGVLVICPRSETISCNLSVAIRPIRGWGVARPRDGANLQR